MRIIKSSLIQLIYRENKIHNHEFTFKKIKSRDKQLKVMNKVQDESEEGSRWKSRNKSEKEEKTATRFRRRWEGKKYS